MEISVGKYLTRDGRKAVVRHVETELTRSPQTAVAGYVYHGNEWCARFWYRDGHYFSHIMENADDLVTAGWPIELVAGRWYRDIVGREGQLVAMPKWCHEYPWQFAARDGDFQRTFSLRADGKLGSYGLLEEIPAPPWAKEPTP